MFAVTYKVELIKSVATLTFAIDIVLMEPKKGPTFDWYIVPSVHGLYW
jgi:hypothetical protein